MQNAIIFAVLSALCFGLGTPFMNNAIKNGASSNGLNFSYAFGLLLVAVVSMFSTSSDKGVVLFDNTKALTWAIIMGLTFATGMKLAGLAFENGGSTALVGVLIACYPIVIPIWMVCTGDMSKVNMPAVLLAVFLVVLGAIVLVLFGQKATVE